MKHQFNSTCAFDIGARTARFIILLKSLQTRCLVNTPYGVDDEFGHCLEKYNKSSFSRLALRK